MYVWLMSLIINLISTRSKRKIKHDDELNGMEWSWTYEPGHVLLAGVAVARQVAWRPWEEAEGALCVERVGNGRRRHRAVRVQVEVARAAALVARPDAGLLAPVALERKFRILEFQLVLGVAPVRYFIVLHGSLSLFSFFFFASSRPFVLISKETSLSRNICIYIIFYKGGDNLLINLQGHSWKN